MRLSPLLAAAFLVAGSLAAHADIIGAGTPIGAGTYSGTLLDTTTSTISGTGKTVSFTESVYQEAVTGYLEFVIQADTTGAYSIDSVNATDFSDYVTGFAYAEDGTATNADPTSVSETNNGKFTFTFGNLASGGDTDSLIIYTDAQNFTAGGVTVGDDTTDPAAFEPTSGVYTPAPTPEPSSLLLLGTGLIGVAGAMRRRLA